MYEKTIYSEVLYKGRLLNLRRDKNKINDEIFTREVVEHPGAVAIIPMINNKTILIKQYRHPVKNFLLEIPAGTLEKNESAEECAHRELIEETGYEAKELKKIMSCYLAPGYSTEIIHIFLAREIKKTKQSLEADEQIEVLSMDLEELKEKIDDGTIKDAKTIVGIFYLFLFNSKQFNFNK